MENLDKLFRFNEMISIVNEQNNLSIPIYSADLSPLGSNSWLAGFIDANACFQIGYTNKVEGSSTKFRIRGLITIEQRMTDPKTGESYEPLFNLIALFFASKLKIVYHNQGKGYFNVCASNRKNIAILINYLDTHTLFSSKYLDYLCCFAFINK